MSDIFYYSNHCKHSQKVIQYISKNNVIDKLSCVCIDKRIRDINNNNILIILENGRQVSMPPSIQTVPALLRVSKNHTVILGSEQIIEYINTDKKYVNAQQSQSSILNNNVEPVSYGFFKDVSSEQFTDYSMSSADLGTKGKDRPIHNYVGVDSFATINAPTEDYQPDKLTSDITIDKLLQQRNLDVQDIKQATNFI
jgi:hypothetical protein